MKAIHSQRQGLISTERAAQTQVDVATYDSQVNEFTWSSALQRSVYMRSHFPLPQMSTTFANVSTVRSHEMVEHAAVLHKLNELSNAHNSSNRLSKCCKSNLCSSQHKLSQKTSTPYPQCHQHLARIHLDFAC